MQTYVAHIGACVLIRTEISHLIDDRAKVNALIFMSFDTIA